MDNTCDKCSNLMDDLTEEGTKMFPSPTVMFFNNLTQEEIEEIKKIIPEKKIIAPFEGGKHIANSVASYVLWVTFNEIGNLGQKYGPEEVMLSSAKLFLCALSLEKGRKDFRKFKEATGVYNEILH